MATKSAVCMPWRAAMPCRAWSNAFARLPPLDRRNQTLCGPAGGNLIGENADAVAGLLRTGSAGERHRARPRGPRPCVRHQRERYFVDTGRELQSELFVIPESERVAHSRQRERPREDERIAGVTRVPIRKAEVPADGLRLVTTGDGLDQGERHGHGRGDPRRRRDAPVDHQPPVRHIVNRRMLVAQLLDVIPMSRRPFPVEQSGLGDDQGSSADADDDRTLGGLASDPSQDAPDRRDGSCWGR